MATCLQCEVCEIYSKITWAWVALCIQGYIVLTGSVAQGGSCRFFLLLSAALSVSTGTGCNSCPTTWLIEVLIRVSLLCCATAGAVNNPNSALWHFCRFTAPVCAAAYIHIGLYRNVSVSAKENRPAVGTPADSEVGNTVVCMPGCTSGNEHVRFWCALPRSTEEDALIYWG